MKRSQGRSFLFRMLFAALLTVLLCTQARAQERRALTLDHMYLNFALNRQTGDVLAIDPKRDVVELFTAADLARGNNKPARSAAVGRMPVDVAFKQLGNESYVLVICAGDQTLRVLKPTLEEVKSIRLSGGNPISVITSLNPADPVVFYNTQEEVKIVDLATMTEVGALAMPRAHFRSTDVTVSADGEYLYTRGLNVSPSGFQSFRLTRDGSKVTATHITYEHNTTQRYVPDLVGESCATGNDLWQADLKAKLGVLPAAPVAFVPEEPVVIGVKQNTLMAMSTNTYKTLGIVPLPAFLKTDERRHHFDRENREAFGMEGEAAWLPLYTQYLVDARNKHLVVALKNAAEVIPLSEFAYAREPFLHVAVPTVEALWCGEPAEIALRPQPGTEVSLGNGPPGMTVQGNVLRWTPPDTFLGVENVELQLRGGGIERVQKLTLTVARRHIALDFPATHFELAPDGKSAVVWSLPQQMHRESAMESVLAVVDLQRGAVVTRRTLPFVVQSAATDGRRVFTTQADADIIRVYRATDLSDDTRLPVASRVWTVEVLGEHLVAQGQTHATVYTCADLKPVLNIVEERLQRMGGGNPGAGPRPFHDGYAIGSYVFGPGFKELRLAGWVGQIGMWNRVIESGRLRDLSGRNIGVFRAQGGEIHPQRPVFAAVIAHNENNRPRSDLAVFDAADGSELVRIPLHLNRPGEQHSPVYMATDIRWSGDTAYTVLPGRLFGYTLKPSDIQSLAKPMCFDLRQDTIILDRQKPNLLKHKIQNPKGAVAYALAGESAELSIDPKTGDMRIDAPAVIAKLATMQVGQTRLLQSWMIDPMQNNLQNEQQRATLEQVLGRRFTNEVLIRIPISISATDADNQFASISYDLFLPVPRDTLAKLAPQTRPSQPRQVQAAPEPPAPSDQRIRALEQRVDKLEGKIDLLLEMMRQKPAATPAP